MRAVMAIVIVKNFGVVVGMTNHQELTFFGYQMMVALQCKATVRMQKFTRVVKEILTVIQQ